MAAPKHDGWHSLYVEVCRDDCDTATAEANARLIASAPELKAELTRLTAILEDRPSLAMEIRKAVYEWDNNVELQKTEHSTFVADRIRGYLKGQP